MAVEKCFTQRFVEAFGLEYPKDADRFVEILERFYEDGSTLGQLFEDVMDAFPDQKDRILDVPIRVIREVQA